MEKFLGIIGGLGPEASLLLYNHIIKKTKAEKDQDHIDMVILNHSSIPDRTDYLLKKSLANPFPHILKDIETLTKLGASLIIIPCNTAHYFYDELQSKTDVKIINMIEETAKYLKEKNIKKVGILATTATIDLKLYQQKLDEYNIEYSIPSKYNQKRIMDIIYNNVKKNKKISKINFHNIKKEMKQNKVDAVIMGCTELSVLKDKFNLNNYFVDPLEISTKLILTHYNKEENYDNWNR